MKTRNNHFPDWLDWNYDEEGEELFIFLNDSTLSISKSAYERTYSKEENKHEELSK